MKIKFIIVVSIIFLIVLLVGCQSTKDTEINVLLQVIYIQLFQII